MYISRNNIGNLYNQILINEVTQEVVDYLDENVEELPFSHIFGDDLRIFIPLHKDPMVNDLIGVLRGMKGFDKVDLKKGEVIRKVQLDPKYGGGEKEQRLNIGTVISKMKLTPEEKQKFLDWYALYKTNLGEEKDRYGVILSRAPIDVMRMSDFKNSGITSCHSSGAGYFNCAVQEAINGGAIAYVVDLDEYNTSLENGYTLQDPELFSDDERGGDDDFEPVARLRVRRLMDTDSNEFAIPDTRIY